MSTQPQPATVGHGIGLSTLATRRSVTGEVVRVSKG